MKDGQTIRLTTATLLVLDVIARNAVDDPPWGYRICEDAGLGSGTVYPILDRLEEAGLIEGRWETGQPADRPRRRLYTITSAGRARCATEAVQRRTRALLRRPALRGGLT